MKRYNTPHRSRVVKTRMTEEEYAEFAQRLSAYHMSQAEFIRQAITGAAIRPIITVSPINDELLAAVGKLTAEYGRIGGNLNQIARTLNEWHSPYPQLAGEVRAAVSDLAALKFEVLQKVGDAVGNIQTCLLYTSLLCRWFRAAVLPQDKELETALFHRLNAKKCAVCGALFTPGSNRAKYCPECAARMKRINAAKRKRKQREKCHALGAEKPL